MQIRNDYTSFQNRNYQEGHTHHITECLLEDSIKQKEGAIGAGRDDVSEKNAVAFSKDGDTYRMSAGQPTEPKRTNKTGRGVLKNFWDALGEEPSDEKNGAPNPWRDHLLSGIHGAAASIRHTFQYQIAERVQSVPAKVKAVLQSAGTRFRRGKDAFTALTGGQTPSGKNSGRRKGKDGQVTSAEKTEDIPMKAMRHSHLMDSYNRTGEYCQLNDNLTYGKIRGERSRNRQ